MQVIVKPNSSKNEITKEVNGVLYINIKAIPENNKANIELIKFLKKYFKKDYKIVSGFTSRKKSLKVTTR
mgnify:CR=1 FL=1|tara:strand:- start:2474 stop:2683 length:210 start_codon:yes stop_codon:yes gene_type:complete